MIRDWILGSGSSVFECSFLYDYELDWAKEYKTRWYRSKDKKGGVTPFASFMMNKKWTMQEEFTNHMLMVQQVLICSNYFAKINFDILGWINNH